MRLYNEVSSMKQYLNSKSEQPIDFDSYFSDGSIRMSLRQFNNHMEQLKNNVEEKIETDET